MQKVLALLALVCAAEASWESFKKLDLSGNAKPDPLELKVKQASDAVGTAQCKTKAFVINLYKRRDRCICMSQQLKNAPFKSERFNAVGFADPRPEDRKFKVKKAGEAAVPTPVTAADMQESNLCDNLFKEGVASGPSHSTLQEMALVCSHFKLWTKLANQPEDAFLVMEDDLPMSPKLMERVNAFTQKYKGKWDFVQVDAYGKNGTEMPAADKVDEFEGAPIYKPSENGDYWGGHMFLLRKTALPKMLYRLKNMKKEPVDWLPKKWANTTINVRTVQFGLINYVDSEKRAQYYKEANCGQYVDMSDINYSGKRAVGNHFNGQRGSKATHEGTDGALQCPSEALSLKKKADLKKK